MSESVAEDIIHLFPHSSSDLVFDIIPLTSVPIQPEPSKPKLIISSKPTMSSHPRTNTSAPSSQQKKKKLKKGT